MLSRLILLALQLIISWFAGAEIAKYIRLGDYLGLFVLGAVFAVLVWVVGLVAAQVLREIGQPSSSTLVASLILALAAAALVRFFPDVKDMLGRIPDNVFPLIGAVLGYHLKR